MSHIIDEAVKDFANAIGLRNYDWGRACPCSLAFREIIRSGSYKGCPNAIGWGDHGATTRLPLPAASIKWENRVNLNAVRVVRKIIR
jgi:hypothetical protein